MPSLDRTIARLKSEAKHFTWNETIRLMTNFGYQVMKARRGSNRKFYHREKDTLVALHQPHNRKELLPYQIKLIKHRLEEDGFL